MNGRTVLAFAPVAFLAATAGCSADGSLSMRPVDAEGLAERASSDLPDDDRPDRDRSVVRRAIENGSATAVGDRPPVDEQLPFRHEERFYRMNYTEVGTEPGYEVGIRVDYNASDAGGAVVEYEDLPAVDRAVLAFPLARTDPDEADLEPGYDVSVGAIYTEAEADSSVLVPTSEYDAVRYEGEVYPIGVDADRETLTVYRYDATRVADSAGEYARQLRDRHEFVLSDLSADERDVVDAALNDTNYIESSDNEAFASLVDRFRSQDPVAETDFYGSYVVRYDGQLYWAEMDYGSYVEDDDPDTPPERTPPVAE